MLFFRYLLPYALVVGVIGGLGVGAFLLTRELVGALAGMSTEARAAILAALATPIVAILSVVATHFYARKREIAAAQLARKTEFYGDFLEEYFELLTSLTGKKGTKPSKTAADELQRKMLDHASKTARRLILWGGWKTIQCYLAMRNLAAETPEGEPSNPNIMLRFEDLLHAIRKELGHPNRGLARGDLLRLFITDIDSFLGGS